MEAFRFSLAARMMSFCRSRGRPRGLDAREKANGVRAFSLHPGSILTGLGRHFSREQRQAFGVYDEHGNRIIDPVRQLKTLEQGAATQVWCAAHPKLDGKGGVYCENVEVARVVPPDERSGWASDDSTRKVGVMPPAIDPLSADRLWALSDDSLTGDNTLRSDQKPSFRALIGMQPR
jgi:hypothetical protein